MYSLFYCASKLPLCSSPVPPLEVYSFFCSLPCLLLSVWLLSALSSRPLTLMPGYTVVTDEGEHLHTSWGVQPFSVTELYLILSPPSALHAHIFSYKVPPPTSLSLLCFQRNPKTFLEVHLSIYKKSCSLFYLPEFSKVHEGDNSMTSSGLFSVTRKQFSGWHGVTWSPTYPPVSPRSFLVSLDLCPLADCLYLRFLINWVTTHSMEEIQMFGNMRRYWNDNISFKLT